MRAFFTNYLEEQAWDSSKLGVHRSDTHKVSPVSVYSFLMLTLAQTQNINTFTYYRHCRKKGRQPNCNDSHKGMGIPLRWKSTGKLTM